MLYVDDFLDVLQIVQRVSLNAKNSLYAYLNLDRVLHVENVHCSMYPGHHQNYSSFDAMLDRKYMTLFDANE